jgi:hypothetical protein
MTTEYHKSISSPYQSTRKTAPNISSKHPSKEDMAKYLGRFEFSADFEVDTSTINTFSSIDNLIAIVCTLKRKTKSGDYVVIGQGRAMNSLGQNNRYIEKAIRSVWNYSFLDSASKAGRILDAFDSPADSKVVTSGGYTGNDFGKPEMITEKQKSFLLELVNTSSTIDEDERDRWSSQVDDLTKDEASEAIKSFRN